MEAQFWIDAWKEGRTNFHQLEFHEKLTEYFPKFNYKDGQNLLVPLCGKSKDLLYLESLKLNVHGVELYDHAVEEFFTENKLSFFKTESQDFTNYIHKNIVISCGDFFKLNTDIKYDFVYDRASLVALPYEMRKTYAKVIKRSTRVGGKCLLITYEYDQTKLDGPTFSVPDSEIHELYQDQFKISLLESKQAKSEGSRLSALKSLKQNVYVLEKIR